MAKISAIEKLLRRLSLEERERLTGILNEEPNLEQWLSDKGLDYIVSTGNTPRFRGVPDAEGNLYEFTRPSPIAMMEPERFRSLAAPTDEEDLMRRGSWIADEIREQGGLNYMPFLEVGKFDFDDLPSVFGHEGRGRSRALEMLGLEKIPVSLEIQSPGQKGLRSVSDRIEWLRKYGKLYPEEGKPDRLPLDISDIKLFADGGRVPNKAVEFASAAAALPTPLMPGVSGRDKQLFLQGALSQLYGLNEEGEPAFLGGMSFKKDKLGKYELVPTFDGVPGLVDEVLSLPTLLGDRAPEFSKRAADRLERLSAMLHEDMKLKPAEGLRENLISAGGTMTAQIPIAPVKAAQAAKPGALKKVGKFLKDLPEWFTPTVEMTPRAYITGTAVGGALNSIPEEEETGGVNVVSKFASGGVAGDLASMKRRYSGGSRSAVRAIDQAIVAIEKGDHESAIERLKGHASNPVVADVLKVLPRFAKGGKVKKARALFSAILSKADGTAPKNRAEADSIAAAHRAKIVDEEDVESGMYNVELDPADERALKRKGYLEKKAKEGNLDSEMP